MATDRPDHERLMSEGGSRGNCRSARRTPVAVLAWRRFWSSCARRDGRPL